MKLAWPRHAARRDVERRAMIRRRTHERQAEGHVDAAVEGERLDRDQRLVVVHRDDRIVGLARLGVEQGIGGMRSRDRQPFRQKRRDCRTDDGLVLAPDRACFARVRIETGHRDAWLLDAEILDQPGMHDAHGFEDEVTGYHRGDGREGNVDRQRHHAQFDRGQHHHRTVTLCREMRGRPGRARNSV